MGRFKGVALCWAVLGIVAANATVAAQTPTAAEITSLLGKALNLPPSGTARQSQMAQVIQELEGNYLTGGESIRSVGLSHWPQFVRLLKEGLSPEAREVWAEKIQQAFAGNEEALFALDCADLLGLSGVLDALGKGERGSELAWSWMKNQNAAGRLAPGNLAQIATIGMKVNVEDAQKIAWVQDLERKWTADDTKLGELQCKVLAGLWSTAGDYAKAQQWALRRHDKLLGTEAVRATAGPVALAGLGEFLEYYNLTGPDKAYPAFAAVLARLAGEGKLKADHPRFYAAPLGTEATRQTVRAELFDSQGVMRLEVAKILTEAYKRAGETQFKAWHDFLNQKITEGDNADAKAMCLLAKAYAAPLVVKKPYRLYSKPWLDKALAAAESEQVRLTVLAELAGFYRDIGRPAVAVNVLESVKGQFSGEQLIGIIIMQQDLRGVAADIEIRKAKERAAAETARKAARLKYYQDFLRRAQSAGNQAEAAKLQAAIARLEAEPGK